MVMSVDPFCKNILVRLAHKKIQELLINTFYVSDFLTGSGFDQKSGATANFLTNVDGSTTCKHSTVNWQSSSRQYGSPGV